MKYIKRCILVSMLVLACSSISVTTAAPPGADTICDGLSGAAFGLCTAAVNVGCGEGGTETPGCAKIQEKFEQIAGETAPWTIPYCDDNSTCAEDEFCNKADGDCDGKGTCTSIPIGCIDALIPVLACDGLTYGNYCEAQWARKNVLCYIDLSGGDPGC